METLAQIRNKAGSLTARLKGQDIVENFGQNEVKQLETYVGDIWAYDYGQRQEINNILCGFNDWCMNYTGQEGHV